MVQRSRQKLSKLPSPELINRRLASVYNGLCFMPLYWYKNRTFIPLHYQIIFLHIFSWLFINFFEIVSLFRKNNSDTINEYLKKISKKNCKFQWRYIPTKSTSSWLEMVKCPCLEFWNRRKTPIMKKKSCISGRKLNFKMC